LFFRLEFLVDFPIYRLLFIGPIWHFDLFTRPVTQMGSLLWIWHLSLRFISGNGFLSHNAEKMLTNPRCAKGINGS
jgi:hypothetical protein